MALISSASVGDKFATGTTAQRPSSPQNGDIRFNTSLKSEAGNNGHIEFYANGWVQLNVRPTPGNAKVGYTTSSGSGVKITGNPGTANQTSGSTQKVELDKNTFVGWYKPPPLTYPMEAQFGCNYNSNTQTIRKSFNVRAIHRWVNSSQSQRKGDAIEYNNPSQVIGKYVCYTGTNDTASCRIERTDNTYPDQVGDGAPPPYVGNQQKWAVYHHRNISISYLYPSNVQVMGYRRN